MTDRPATFFQWAQEHGEVGGVLTSHRQLTAQLRRAGLTVTYVDTGSLRRVLAMSHRLWRHRSVHLFHITRLWRAMVAAPVFALLPGRVVLVLHSGSVGRQLASMGKARRSLFILALHAYDEIWAVNDEIRLAVPAALASRVRLVSPFSGGATDVVGGEVGREPHLLAVATNAGLPHYNAELAIAAAGLVRKEWPDARLLVLAYGAQGGHLGRLRASISRLEWAELTFDASAAEVHEVLRRSAVFLRPTAWDGDSVVVREALAAGARVVASSCAPRPAGVELADLNAVAFADAVLHGGPVSDGRGLAVTSMFDAAMAASRH